MTLNPQSRKSQLFKAELRKHYKNHYYKKWGQVHHSETQEELVLYEALEPSDLGPLWVRPKEMFEESLLVDGVTRARFAKVVPVIEHLYEMTDAHKIEASSLLSEVFGDGYSIDDLKKKISGKDIHYSRCWLEGAFVGFKLGYREDSTTFYSALGAVAPASEGLGLGRLLLEEQHTALQAAGYKRVTTKTKNKWARMLVLNIRCGFQVTGTETRSNGEIKICMEKALSS